MAGTPQNYPTQAPSTEQQITQQPQYYPQPAYYAPPPRKVPPERKWLWIGVIGIIIVIIGGIIAAIGQSTPPPDRWGYKDEREYYQDYSAWLNNTKTMLSVGKILNVIGDALVGIMTIGLMVDAKISDEKRKYLLLMAAVLFGLLMIATMVIYMNTLIMYSASGPVSYP